MPAVFTKEIISFLSDLSRNNNREWFNRNKVRFQTLAEKPFHQFIDLLITKIKVKDPRITLTAKEAVFRIYKDIRFSKDKTPYKEYLSALISPGGRKDKNSPGLYIELKPDGISVYSGIYEPDAKQLAQVRHYIAGHLKEFEKAISDKRFIKRFGKILGEKNKILPAELRDAAQRQELVYNKSFYFVTHLNKSMITSDKLIKEILQCYDDAAPVSRFLVKALE